MEEGLKKPGKNASKAVTPPKANGDTTSKLEAENTAAVGGTSGGTDGTSVSSAPDPPIEPLEGRNDEAAVMAVISASTSMDDLPDPKTIGETAEEEESIRQLSNGNVLCPHGKADVRKAEGLKRVSEVSSRSLSDPLHGSLIADHASPHSRLLRRLMLVGLRSIRCWSFPRGCAASA